MRFKAHRNELIKTSQKAIQDSHRLRAEQDRAKAEVKQLTSRTLSSTPSEFN